MSAPSQVEDERNRISFSFSASLVSSIYPESELVLKLSKVLANSNANRQMNVEILKDLASIPNGVLLKFYPVIINCLCKIICYTRLSGVGKTAVNILYILLNKLSLSLAEKAPVCNTKLLGFVRCILDTFPDSGKYLHERLTKFWLEIMENPVSIFYYILHLIFNPIN
jgi:hypothetical protein